METILDLFGLETLLNYNFLNIYSLIPIFSLLLLASFFDYKTFKIPNELNGAFFILRFLLILKIGISWSNVGGLIIGALLVLIPAMIILKPMGGDIKMIAVLGFYLGPQNILILLIISISLALIYYGIIYFTKKEFKDIPLAPFILGGGLILIIGVLTCFGQELSRF